MASWREYARCVAKSVYAQVPIFGVWLTISSPPPRSATGLSCSSGFHSKAVTLLRAKKRPISTIPGVTEAVDLRDMRAVFRRIHRRHLLLVSTSVIYLLLVSNG